MPKSSQVQTISDLRSAIASESKTHNAFVDAVAIQFQQVLQNPCDQSAYEQLERIERALHQSQEVLGRLEAQLVRLQLEKAVNWVHAHA